MSSTAVTLSFANRTKREPSLAPMAAGAIAIAWTIMLGRVAVLVALIEPQLLRTLAIPLGGDGGRGAARLAAHVPPRRRRRRPSSTLKNPFELGSAIKVSLVFAVVLLATKAATEYLGNEGLYLAAALSGTTDVDAVTLSTAKLAKGGLAPVVATIAITIAIAMNTIVKTALAGWVGGPGLGKRMAIVGGLVIAAGAAGVAVIALA